MILKILSDSHGGCLGGTAATFNPKFVGSNPSREPVDFSVRKTHRTYVVLETINTGIFYKDVI